MTIERPMFPPRAESVDSFSRQPAIGQPDRQTIASDSAKAVGGLSRRLMLAGLSILPTSVVGIPTTATAERADAELIALGRKFEILVDAYYVARQPWARAMRQYRSELDKRLGADRGYSETPKIVAVQQEIRDRVGLQKASDQLSAAYERTEPIAEAINVMPVLRSKGCGPKRW